MLLDTCNDTEHGLRMSYTKQQMQIIDLKAQNRRLKQALASIIKQQAQQATPRKRIKRIVT